MDAFCFCSEMRACLVEVAERALSLTMNSVPGRGGALWKRFAWRNAVTFLVVFVCTMAFVAAVEGIFMMFVATSHFQDHDFISYWAAARQVLHHANPYDGDAILRLEHQQGFPESAALIMRNLPPALLLVLPFGLFSLRVGTTLWALVLLGCLIVSVRLLWIMHGRPRNRRHLLAYSFGPALLCVVCGQTGLFALLGLVLFLRWHRSQPFWAGVSLWLCALKPHLFLPFWVVLAAWVIFSRGYRVLLGLCASLGVSSLAVYFIDPRAWSQYREMMRVSGIGAEFVPCWSTVLRFGVDRHAMWLQYVLAAAACIWAVDYYRRRRDGWDWMKHGSVLMLVSVLVAPYAWITDQPLVIPALLEGAYRTTRDWIAPVVLASALIEAGSLWSNPMHSARYLWAPPLWLAWYLWGTREKKAGVSSSEEMRVFSSRCGVGDSN